ncbi:MAG: NADH-quinone oxidoreductase subunit H [Firmicutes bacterium]|jgi:formate hydrogenlyase subunit 4|nr:NADH-quinone oxidoreductase subunit H [Bacillota bacterium]
MHFTSITAGLVQLFGGLVASMLIPGFIQSLKAKLQGRVGPGSLQPYRDLRRLWNKSTVSVSNSTLTYRIAPSVVATSMGLAVLVVPVSSLGPNWGVGHDAFVLGGVLALSRLALVLAAWDTRNGFSLMAASRDLTISIFTETAMLISLSVAALVAGSTDMQVMISRISLFHVWSSPAPSLALAAFSLVVIAETGHQPVDNPDTHLELTMIHEGMTLEYAGRDLAMLQWSGGVKHWIMLVMLSEIFLPHFQNAYLQLLCLPLTVIAICIILAIVESTIVKMRLLNVPRFLGLGTILAFMGILALKVPS